MELMFAPIALFAFRRPDHTKLVIDALLLNKEASESELYIYCDGPRGNQDLELVSQVRDYVRTVRGFKSIHIIERNINYGLAKSIINGVTEILEKYENIIVLEDDILTSPYFLRFMNTGLVKYKYENQVASIHGYVYPVEQKLPNTFFLRGADCWGWATWRRAWQKFNPDGMELLRKLKNSDLIEDFDFHGAYPYSEMLSSQVKGQNQSWAIRWHASMYLENMLTLYPGKTLVNNIGHDNSGTHSGMTDKYESITSRDPIEIQDIKIEVSKRAYTAFENFMRNKGFIQTNSQIKNKIKSIIRLITPPIFFTLYNNFFLIKKSTKDTKNSEPQEQIVFNGEYFKWEDALQNCIGYNSSDILEKVISSTKLVASGAAVYERDSVLFDHIEYSWPLLAGLLLASSRSNGNLNVIDYGGSLGSSYYQNRKFLNLLPTIKWNVIEQPNYVVAGNKYFKNKTINFYDNLSNCLLENIPNVILLSSVLQYLPDPYQILKDLIKINADVIVLDRTCYYKNSIIDLLRIQTVPDSIYSATYPCWFLIENKVIQLLVNNNYTLIEDFLAIDNLDDRAVWKGHIFCKTNKG
ncbi:methyltransferase, TIGR04325 family [Orrella sp. NBD-18]|uniref:Methyltransferase, TIGR04325 family n=1 Tax=Sheuella amnicola TaxID=2707330 RepID=A0A6B2R1G5_9BURK|nr:methyltransferase, TIGR04325 family [Sheuella amnicola]NDY83474.1 methyltransferase, TIGR04325 family [Sheuella amnicola]